MPTSDPIPSTESVEKQEIARYRTQRPFHPTKPSRAAWTRIPWYWNSAVRAFPAEFSKATWHLELPPWSTNAYSAELSQAAYLHFFSFPFLCFFFYFLRSAVFVRAWWPTILRDRGIEKCTRRIHMHGEPTEQWWLEYTRQTMHNAHWYCWRRGTEREKPRAQTIMMTTVV